MKSLLRWFADNSPAVNCVSLAILLIGGWCAYSLQREFWPHAELNTIDVIVEYPGASPLEVESGICEKIEESIRNIPGVRRVFSTARSGRGVVSVQMQSHLSDSEVDEAVARVRRRVDSLGWLPQQAERPIVARRPQRTTTMQLGVVGRKDISPRAQLRLRELAEQIRLEVLDLEAISDVTLVGAAEFEINVEMSEATLRAHGMSLQQAAARIRDFSEEVAAGVLRTGGHEYVLRGQRVGLRGDDLAEIPILSSSAGAQKNLGQMGTVFDAFSEDTCINRINGRPAVVIRIDAMESDDILDVGQQVHAYIDGRDMPDGFELVTLMDRTDDVAGRLNLLVKNGWLGLLLVFALLTLLLEFRFALWVAAGIPLALAGSACVMYLFDQSLNMSSMFAFLIAIGIVVDDAIIVGENIFSHHQRGKSPTRAAIDGCCEVMPAVLTSVLTTSIAFLPILLATGRTGRMTHVMPLAIISVLAFSLAEALLFLPCHLAKSIRRDRGASTAGRTTTLKRIIDLQNGFARRFERLITRAYIPLVNFCLRNLSLTFAVSLGLLVVSLAAVTKRAVPFSMLPKMDWNFCTILVKFPEGTTKRVTDSATLQIEDSIEKLRHQIMAESGSDAIMVVHRTVGFGTVSSGETHRGSHVGSITIQLVDSSMRDVTSQQMIRRLRNLTGTIAGGPEVTFAAGPIGLQSPSIEFKLMADRAHADELEGAAATCLAFLRDLPRISDAASDLERGKSEYCIRLRDDAGSSGITTGDISRAIRAAVHGEEALRLQRGRHEVPVRIRYAKHERNSLHDLRQVTVTSKNGDRFPVSELAEVNVAPGYSTIHRRDQMRAVTITADADGKSSEMVRTIKSRLLGKLESTHPNVRVTWDGQRAETRESMRRMRYGFMAVLLAMFVLLTMQFRSYALPFLVLVIVPFSMIGAVAGHYLLDLPLTLFSIYGIVALAGIVVNDSIVLIDFVHKQAAQSDDLQQAIVGAACRRLRPILLTSLTTIVCLIPVMSETSRQSQVLVPMAVSVAFGLALSTCFVLLLVPALYMVVARRSH